MENKTTVAENVLSWQAAEFEHHQKTLAWYIVFAIAATAMLIFSFFSHSIITVITFVLIVVMGFAFSHRKPRVVLHQLTPTGIVLGDTMYPYKSIKSFWIIYEPPQIKTLNIETTAYLNPHMAIQLGDQDPVPVKLYLKKYLTEDINRDESLVDVISRHLKI